MVDVCTEYTSGLALEDFVPVVLAAVGCFFLAEASGRAVPAVRRPAFAAVAVLVIGGLCKSSWKLLVTMHPCHDYEILEQLLFPLLSLGFAILGWAVLSGRAGRVIRLWPWIVGLAVAWLGAIASRNMKPLLFATAIASLVMAVGALMWAARIPDRLAVALFVVYLVGSLVLPPLGSKPNQSLGLQWAEQLVNTLCEAAFVLGAYLLMRGRSRATLPRKPDPALEATS